MSELGRKFEHTERWTPTPPPMRRTTHPAEVLLWLVTIVVAAILWLNWPATLAVFL